MAEVHEASGRKKSKAIKVAAPRSYHFNWQAKEMELNLRDKLKIQRVNMSCGRLIRALL